MNRPLSTWYDALKASDAYGLDIETTGTSHKTSSIYNIGISSFKDQKHKNFFMPNLVSAEKLEEDFLSIHNGINAKLFAKQQVDRGILDEYKKAIDSKDLTSVDKAFQSFISSLSESDNKFILGQNLAFENRMFREIIKHPSNIEGQNLSQSTVSSYNDATKRLGTHRTVANELFSQYDIADIKAGVGVDQETSINRKSKDIVKAFKEHGTRSQEAMMKMRDYSSHYDLVMDKYKSLIADPSKTPIVDLQDISKALYARAAIAGDLNPEYFNRAYSVDFLSKSLGLGAEKHLGAEDNISTKKIFDIFTGEYDKYSKDPNYRSEILQDINKKIESTQEVNKSFVKNLKSFINESPDHASKNISKSLDYYSHIDIGKSVRENIHTKSLSLLQEENGVDKAINYLDSINFDEVKEASNRVKNTPKPKTSNLKRNILVGGTIAGASMMLSGGKQDKEYNTYDELYNNQYYGSGFADWQNRDNSNQLLYKGVGW